MTDLSKTIIPKSDQLNADDLITGPRTITVTRVTGTDSAEQPVSIYFEGDNGKPYKPGLSMRRVLVQVWGEEGDKYVGRSMTLYLDPEVKFGGIKVGGIRISHMSHMDNQRTLMLTATRGKKAGHTVKPLANDPSERVLHTAQEEADKGKEAFTAFWNSDFGKTHRTYLKQHLSDLQKRVDQAEENAKPLSQRISGDQQQDEPAPVDKFSFEYSEGATAARDGKKINQCPYDGGQQQAEWLAGWNSEKGSEG